MIVDSHCHLDYPQLYNQLDDVVNRAFKNNVNLLLTICTTLESFKKIELIIAKYKNIYGTFGIHPHETEKNNKIDCQYIVKAKNKNKKIIGIGETGLDFFYNHSDKKIQKKIFIQHIEAASKLEIPLIVHTRNAEIETFDILKSEKKNSNLKVLIHCFTGSSDFAKKLIDLNCFISISGIITFKKSEKLINTISQIPVNNLLIETDSPYLSPSPYRGKENEPSFIKYTLEKLAEIKQITTDELSNITTNNFQKLFNIK